MQLDLPMVMGGAHHPLSADRWTGILAVKKKTVDRQSLGAKPLN
jgi:hypothetical protein